MLHGDSANATLYALTKLLEKVKDPFDGFQRLHSGVRSTVVLGAPGRLSDYLPLAISAKAALTSDGRFVKRHVQPKPTIFSEEAALAFFTTWSTAFQETFTRATIQVMEHWCATPSARHGLTIIPPFWTPTDSRRWLSAFAGGVSVQPLALMPTPMSIQHSLWDTSCNATCLAAYRKDSNAFFAARQKPNCFKQVDVCDFSSFAAMPGRSRPWSTMQAIGAHLAGLPHAQSLKPHLLGCESRNSSTHDNQTLPCPLRVLFVIRHGRRRLSNLDELLTACTAFLPHAKRRFGALRTECMAYSFAGGIELALPLLRTVDVVVGPHGADLINALALHAGASVVEVLPVKRYGCPCLFFKYLFSNEPDKIFHYQAASTNATFASGPSRKTFHGDVALPPSVMLAALTHIVNVGGRPSRYHYKRFEY